MTECVEVHSKREKDDKVRCWFPHCNKLFKNLDFLKKHVALKHEAFATEIVLKNAEPFMRARYIHLCLVLSCLLLCASSI